MQTPQVQKAQVQKAMASLGAGMLGRRVEGRRVPLSFAPIEPEVPDSNIPEVLRQIGRLAEALGLDTPEPHNGEGGGKGAKRRRIACTVRLDPERHAQLRRVAMARATSAQCVLVEAFDQHLAGFANTPTISGPVISGPSSSASRISATPLSRAQRPTGTQP